MKNRVVCLFYKIVSEGDNIFHSYFYKIVSEGDNVFHLYLLLGYPKTSRSKVFISMVILKKRL